VIAAGLLAVGVGADNSCPPPPPAAPAAAAGGALPVAAVNGRAEAPDAADSVGLRDFELLQPLLWILVQLLVLLGYQLLALSLMLVGAPLFLTLFQVQASAARQLVLLPEKGTGCTPAAKDLVLTVTADAGFC
jgi:hypothetical protein